MDAQHLRILAEELPVLLDGDIDQLRLRVHLPCRITVVDDDLCPGQLEAGTDGIGHVRQVAHHIRTLRSDNRQRMLIRLHTGHIARCLYHVSQRLVLAICQRSVVDSLQGKDDVVRNLLREYTFGLSTLKMPDHRRISHMKLILNGCTEDVPVCLDLLLSVSRNSEEHLPVTGNRIVHLAGVPSSPVRHKGSGPGA